MTIQRTLLGLDRLRELIRHVALISPAVQELSPAPETQPITEPQRPRVLRRSLAVGTDEAARTAARGAQRTTLAESPAASA